MNMKVEEIGQSATTDTWIEVNHDHPELKMWPLQIGLYWAIIEGDYEPGEAGSMLYDFPSYKTIFQITGFDEETGVPIGSGYFTDEEWESVMCIWQNTLFEPEWSGE